MVARGSIWHVHSFGLYSVLGRHEWAMEEEGIPVAEYQHLAKQFNPKPHAAQRLGKTRQASRHEIHGDDHQAP